MRNNNEEFYISVDGGASKTEFCVHSIVTKSERHFFSGSSNYKNAGTDIEKNLLDEGLYHIFETMRIKPEQIKGLVMGLSGCDSARDHDCFMNIVALTGIPRERIYIGNDCELAFFSEGKPPGLSIVAGTGSISVGIAVDYTKARSGGWGSTISDEGSGGWIGIYVIRDFLRYYDGYGEYRNIFDVIRLHMGQDSFDAMPGLLSLSPIEEIAEFARLVDIEAVKGDEYCASIIDKAAGLIAEIAHSVYMKLGFENERSVDVVLLGSLYKSAFFCEALKGSLTALTKKDNLHFCRQTKSPVMGGIELARSMFV